MLSRSPALLRSLQFAALLAFLVLGLLLYRSLGLFVAAGEQVHQTRDVIEETYRARLAALRSGIWLRNHARTRSPEMLARVRDSANDGSRAVERLVKLTQDHPALHLEAHALVREMGDLLEAYRSGADLAEQQGVAALLPVLDSRVQVDHTHRVRERLDAIEKAAHALFENQARLERQHLQQLRRLMIALGVLLVAALLWTAGGAVQLLRQRKAASAHERSEESDPLADPLNR